MDGADLYFDPNEVDAELVVACWLSHGPRSGDPSFDPRPGDLLVAGDADGYLETVCVLRRDGNWAWVQIVGGAEA